MTTDILTAQLREFVTEQEGNWYDRDWVRLLDRLEAQGIEVEDVDSLGLALESERLRWVLERAKIRGLGPKRIATVVDHYPSIWHLRRARPEDVAALPSLYPRLATEVLTSVE